MQKQTRLAQRSDFQKVLTECYREGRAYATTSPQVRRRLKQSLHRQGQDALPASSHERQLDRHKSFGENLAPLCRYLAKQEGRPWATKGTLAVE